VPAFDQRGASFDRVFNGNRVGGAEIDIGAIEFQPPPQPSLGDYDRNTLVDARDYVVWRDTLGTTVTAFAGADGDGDGMVDQEDFGVWRANFGRSLPRATASVVLESSEPPPQELAQHRAQQTSSGVATRQFQFAAPQNHVLQSALDVPNRRPLRREGSSVLAAHPDEAILSWYLSLATKTHVNRPAASEVDSVDQSAAYNGLQTDSESVMRSMDLVLSNWIV
jgi:hypothetical protein